MARVTGIGGIFLRARDRAALSAWYRDLLGLPVQEWGGAVFPLGGADAGAQRFAIWSLFAPDTDYFGPGGQACMVNFAVDDLDALLAKLRAAGCAVDEKVHEDENGRFGGVTAPEGNRVELWQPPRA
jgi:predicted enzyme related to lactoylglutathione lyase